MSMSARILPAFEHVIEGTRQHLESIPDDRLGWRPHDKSYTIGELGTHLANLPSWVMVTIGQDELDVAPPGEDPPRLEPFGSSSEMVRTIDENATVAQASIEGASDEDLMAEWTLLKGGEVLFTLPKIAVLRTFVMDHMIHHRGQLTVYLRLLDVPVKQTFGPTADFPDM
ncbi:MAG: DinB family protein [Gemmatimonadota bacterium]